MEPHAPGSGPLLIVLSGPSGVGKDAVLSRMKEQGRGFHFTVTATTRRRRPTERDGVDYIFHSEQTFREMIDRGELIEWAQVHGHLYGVPRAQVTDAMARGLDVIMKIDVQGRRHDPANRRRRSVHLPQPAEHRRVVTAPRGAQQRDAARPGHQAEDRREGNGACRRVRLCGRERHRSDRRNDPRDRSHHRARAAALAPP